MVDEPHTPQGAIHWSAYYERQMQNGPRQEVVEAVARVTTKGRALDVGAGGLNNTSYLLAQGFSAVDAFDSNPEVMDIVAKTHLASESRLTASVASFRDYPYGEHNYDIALVTYVLHMSASKEEFADIVARIKKSLTSGGIFCGIVLGEKDDWVRRWGAIRIGHTREELMRLFADMEDVVVETAKDEDDCDAAGNLKHWHSYKIIARKV